MILSQLFSRKKWQKIPIYTKNLFYAKMREKSSASRKLKTVSVSNNINFSIFSNLSLDMFYSGENYLPSKSWFFFF